MRDAMLAAEDYSVTPKAGARPNRKILGVLTSFALMAFASPAVASEWRYGCRGTLPSGDAPIIIFNRFSLIMLPEARVKGPLIASVREELLSSSFKGTDNNSGLVPTMVFTLADHLDQKLTLTELSSKTISDVRERAGSQPRFAQATTTTKVYRWVSDGIYAGPYDIKMDCINYELSAPVFR
jgi:hypothetical protein